MGKSKNSKYGYKGNRQGPPRVGEEGTDDGIEDEAVEKKDRSNVGMMPPSDSEEEEGAEGPKEGAEPKPKDGEASAAAVSVVKPAVKKAPAPGSDSEEDSDDDSDDSEDSEPEKGAPAAPKPKPKAAGPPIERTAEQVRKDLERLDLIRTKREEDRLKRIADDGWDRYSPVTETNRAPGHAAPPPAK